MKRSLDLRRSALLRASGSRYGEKVFLCVNGRRHLIREGCWLAENGFVWPDDVIQVAPEVLDAFQPGRPAARWWSDSDWRNPPRTDVLQMREIAVSRLRGSGIEVGAGASPMAIPLECKVQYVDVYDIDQLSQNYYRGQDLHDFVTPDLKAQFEDLSPIPDESLDFVVACHVIEHTRDPIGTIVGAWRKLRRGGSIVLVVPDMTRTFDRNRKLTELPHLIEDFRTPDASRLRDQEHFREFYAKAFSTPPEEYEATWRSQWEAAFPIHYHTWTYASFSEMVRWMAEAGILPDLAEVWCQRPLLDAESCLEFWFVLRKA